MIISKNILYKISLFFGLLLLTACPDKPCIDADDFGFPKVFVSSEAGNLKVSGDTSSQQVEPTDSKQVLTGGYILAAVQEGGRWTSWFGPSNSNQVSEEVPNISCKYFYANGNLRNDLSYAPPPAGSSPNDISPNMIKANSRLNPNPSVAGGDVYSVQIPINAGASPDTIDGANPDHYSDSLAPCWFYDGMGLYVGLADNNGKIVDLTKHIPDAKDPAKHLPFYREKDGFILNGTISEAFAGAFDHDPGNSHNGPEMWDRLYFKIVDRYYEDNEGSYRVILKAGTRSPYKGPIERLIEYVTDPIKRATEAIYRGVTENADYINIVRLFLVIFVILQGYKIIMHQVNSKNILSFSALSVIKVSLLVVLSSNQSWDFFYNHLFRFFGDGVDSISALYLNGLVAGSADPSSHSWYSLDETLRRLFSEETNAKIASLVFSNFIGLFALIAIYYAIAIFLMYFFRVLFNYLVAVFMMGILIIITPFFLILLLFSQTAGKAKEWFGQFFAFSIQQLILFASLGLMLQIIVSYFQQVLGFRVCYETFFSFDILGQNIFKLKAWEPAVREGYQKLIPVDLNNNNHIDYKLDATYTDEGVVNVNSGEYALRNPDIPFFDPGLDAEKIKKYETNKNFLSFGEILLFVVTVYLTDKFLGFISSFASALQGGSGKSDYANLIGSGDKLYGDVKSGVQSLTIGRKFANNDERDLRVELAKARGSKHGARFYKITNRTGGIIGGTIRLSNRFKDGNNPDVARQNSAKAAGKKNKNLSSLKSAIGDAVNDNGMKDLGEMIHTNMYKENLSDMSAQAFDIDTMFRAEKKKNSNIKEPKSIYKLRNILINKPKDKAILADAEQKVLQDKLMILFREGIISEERSFTMLAGQLKNGINPADYKAFNGLARKAFEGRLTEEGKGELNSRGEFVFTSGATSGDKKKWSNYNSSDKIIDNYKNASKIERKKQKNNFFQKEIITLEKQKEALVKERLELKKNKKVFSSFKEKQKLQDKKRVLDEAIMEKTLQIRDSKINSKKFDIRRKGVKRGLVAINKSRDIADKIEKNRDKLSRQELRRLKLDYDIESRNANYAKKSFSLRSQTSRMNVRTRNNELDKLKADKLQAEEQFNKNEISREQKRLKEKEFKIREMAAWKRSRGVLLVGVVLRIKDNIYYTRGLRPLGFHKAAFYLDAQAKKYAELSKIEGEKSKILEKYNNGEVSKQLFDSKMKSITTDIKIAKRNAKIGFMERRFKFTKDSKLKKRAINQNKLFKINEEIDSIKNNARYKELSDKSVFNSLNTKEKEEYNVFNSKQQLLILQKIQANRNVKKTWFMLGKHYKYNINNERIDKKVEIAKALAGYDEKMFKAKTEEQKAALQELKNINLKRQKQLYGIVNLENRQLFFRDKSEEVNWLKERTAMAKLDNEQKLLEGRYSKEERDLKNKILDKELARKTNKIFVSGRIGNYRNSAKKEVLGLKKELINLEFKNGRFNEETYNFKLDNLKIEESVLNPGFYKHNRRRREEDLEVVSSDKEKLKELADNLVDGKIEEEYFEAKFELIQLKFELNKQKQELYLGLVNPVNVVVHKLKINELQNRISEIEEIDLKIFGPEDKDDTSDFNKYSSEFNEDTPTAFVVDEEVDEEEDIPTAFVVDEEVDEEEDIPTAFVVDEEVDEEEDIPTAFVVDEDSEEEGAIPATVVVDENRTNPVSVVDEHVTIPTATAVSVEEEPEEERTIEVIDAISVETEYKKDESIPTLDAVMDADVEVVDENIEKDEDESDDDSETNNTLEDKTEDDLESNNIIDDNANNKEQHYTEDTEYIALMNEIEIYQEKILELSNQLQNFKDELSDTNLNQQQKGYITQKVSSLEVEIQSVESEINFRLKESEKIMKKYE